MLLPNKIHLARTNRLRYECLLERVNRGPCPVRRDGLRTGLDKGVLVRRQVSGQCQCSVKEKGNQGPGTAGQCYAPPESLIKHGLWVSWVRC